jgi:hypothetical protein
MTLGFFERRSFGSRFYGGGGMFGGGRHGGGGGGGDAGAQQRHNDMMAQMAEQNRQASRQAAEMAAQSKAQQAQMEKQLQIMEQSRQDALKGQQAQLEQLKASQVKPDPAARVDERNDDPLEQRKVAARRQGLRRSILAGESFQDAPMLTGPSTLGA